MSVQLEDLAREERRNKRFLSVGIAAMALALVVVLVRLSQFASNQEKVLRLSEQNHDELAAKNKALEYQVDASRDILTQLYAALNASQKQVSDLGGTPLHFEFTAPTTTTTGPPATLPGGKPAPTTTTTVAPTTSQNAGGATNPIALAIEALFVLPVLVTIPPDVLVPPPVTIPPVDTLPDLTVPLALGVTIP